MPALLARRHRPERAATGGARRRVWRFAARSLILFGLAGAAFAQYVTQDSSALDFNRPWLEQLLATEIVSLSRQGDQVHFETTGRLAKYDSRRYAWSDSFTLKRGGQFHLRDRHGRIRFVVREFDDENVHIEAQSLMNHAAGTESNLTLVVPYREFGYSR